MPPTILFHGDADTVVDHRQSADLDRKLRESGNVSRLVTVPGGSHAFSTDMPEWRDRAREMVRVFLKEQGLVE
jgi:dipeptidyl aminopeptidase/acylaminoacyl peptidase